MKLEDYFAQKIFEPLGMTRSMYCNSLENVLHRAHGYGLRNGAIRRAPMVQYTWVFAPGAICSTAGDLVTWLQALHGGKVLSTESYAEMTTPSTLADGTTLRYGMGIKVGEDHRGLRYIGHGGTAPRLPCRCDLVSRCADGGRRADEHIARESLAGQRGR